MRFKVSLIEKITTVIEAETMEDAYFWAQTHIGKDIEDATSDYECEFAEEVNETDDKAAFEI